jgi:glycine/D-amino acid oxidase-like deaminating enzyme
VDSRRTVTYPSSDPFCMLYAESTKCADKIMQNEKYDLAVVGAGIVGLAHALIAARRGLKVIVVDRDAQANGASVRNFGFVTVSGQQAGDCWRRAMRSRDIWAEIAPQAGIAVTHRGLAVAARYAESLPVLEAFLGTPMGAGCKLLGPEQARAAIPGLRDDVRAWSAPHFTGHAGYWA